MKEPVHDLQEVEPEAAGTVTLDIAPDIVVDPGTVVVADNFAADNLASSLAGNPTGCPADSSTVGKGFVGNFAAAAARTVAGTGNLVADSPAAGTAAPSIAVGEGEEEVAERLGVD